MRPTATYKARIYPEAKQRCQWKTCLAPHQHSFVVSCLMKTANIHSKYARKKARGRPGITNGRIASWECWRWDEREKSKAVTARAETKADRVRTKEERKGAASERPRGAQGAKVCTIILRFILHSVDPLTKPKVPILVPDSPKSSEAIEGSGYESTPSCLAFGAAGARGGCPGPSATRALRKRTP